MTAAWGIDSRPSMHSTWKADPAYQGLTHEDVLVMGEWLATRYPLGQYRLHDSSTGEVVHLGRDGKPMPVDVTRLDRRTEEQRQADIAADRYEAAMERGRNA